MLILNRHICILHVLIHEGRVSEILRSFTLFDTRSFGSL